jgi:hypothetical protein
MNSVMERWIGSCWRELLDRTLVGNQRHLMIALREYEDFHNGTRPHPTLNQAASPRPLPAGVTDLHQFRVQRRDRARGVIHEYRLVAQVVGSHWSARQHPKVGIQRRRPADVRPDYASASRMERSALIADAVWVLTDLRLMPMTEAICASFISP